MRSASKFLSVAFGCEVGLGGCHSRARTDFERDVRHGNDGSLASRAGRVTGQANCNASTGRRPTDLSRHCRSLIAARMLPRAEWEAELRYYGCDPLEGKGSLNTAELWQMPWERWPFTVPLEDNSM